MCFFVLPIHDFLVWKIRLWGTGGLLGAAAVGLDHPARCSGGLPVPPPFFFWKSFLANVVFWRLLTAAERVYFGKCCVCVYLCEFSFCMNFLCHLVVYFIECILVLMQIIDVRLVKLGLYVFCKALRELLLIRRPRNSHYYYYYYYINIFHSLLSIYCVYLSIRCSLYMK